MKYHFEESINDKLISFENHLKKKAYSQSTTKQKSNYTGLFLAWLESENLPVKDVVYKDMLSFIDYCHLEKLSPKQINTILLAVRNYYEYLKESDPKITNPAQNLRVKGETRKQPVSLTEYTELEKLYTEYPCKTNRDKRNKVILGLLIYQGITTEELHCLQITDLNLKQGKITIAGNRRRNSRKLDLQPCQILELHEYLNKIRPKIKAGKTDQLIISMEGKLQLKNSLHHLFHSVKKKNSGIGSAKQIRMTVITHWLKTRNLREVQYMAGHKYVSSTERYQENDLENLQKNVEKYHPLNESL
ncbi:tyrosine-type recombinase/integrase [Marinifilum fragile]|uniref:tyrosine-type recombinase/integrase n=1 Tax=Marinifilum fragile TaxID=570161 RepID=UPI002AA74B4C|nr:tyrosine-type recombinase/integrase [Marinifilum fragile]